MSLFARVADLPLTVDSASFAGLERSFGEFRRRTTVVTLRGGGHEGAGEDVIWLPELHDWLQDGPALDIAHTGSFASFSAHLDEIALWPGEPPVPAFALYRRWAFESAALDLALRQAGTNLPAVLEREPQPLRYVVSFGLGSPPSFAPIDAVFAHEPGAAFKLDAGADWDDALIAALREQGRAAVIDLKGYYRNTPVDLPADPDLYRRICAGLPDALIEDPWVDEATRPVLAPHAARLTWDEPIHSWDDVEALPFRPRVVNSKPSRFGSVQTLFDFHDRIAAEGLGAYGGGQAELGPGRGQAQLIAALLHPDGPNDLAPMDHSLLVPSPMAIESVVAGFARAN